MDDELFTEKYDRHIAETPEEVRKFLWSKGFQVLVAKLSSFHKLTNAQADILKQAIFDNLIQINSSEETADILKNRADIHPSIVEQLMVDINALFIEPSAQEVENTLAEQAEDETSEPEPLPPLDIPLEIPQAPKEEPISSLLGARITGQGVVTPSVRDHTIDKIQSDSELPQVPQAPRSSSIDPYRELPDK